MGQGKENDYGCQVCGSEADLILEGFDTVESVLKAGTLVCQHCGSEEHIVLTQKKGDETTKAVSLAVQREKEAYLFYTKAAQKTASERARDMFTQLADFELNHYKKMIHLSHSLQERGEWVPYSGQSEAKPRQRIEELEARKDTKDNDIDALNLAIKKEEEAGAFYREMVEKTEDSMGKNMFKKLAAEEELHRKILNDQLYALSNRGLWAWGD